MGLRAIAAGVQRPGLVGRAVLRMLGIELFQPVAVLPADTLLGSPVAGFEGRYWHLIAGDETRAGFTRSGVPHTRHLPTGSEVWYRKVFAAVNGREIAVWEKCPD